MRYSLELQQPLLNLRRRKSITSDHVLVGAHHCNSTLESDCDKHRLELGLTVHHGGDNQVVLKVRPDGGQVDLDGDTEGLENVAVTDAAKLENVG